MENNVIETSVVEQLTIEPNVSRLSETSWSITTVEDPTTKELILPLPAELLDQFGWQLGDTIQWSFDKELKSYILKKKEFN